MADENPGPDAIAYKILLGIAKSEGKKLESGYVIEDRAWILSTLEEIYRAMSYLSRK